MVKMDYDQRDWDIRIRVNRRRCYHLTFPGNSYYCTKINKDCNKDVCPLRIRMIGAKEAVEK